MTRFQGRRALVTGGASGIGRATAELLAREGARVSVLDHVGDGIRGDVRDEEDVVAAAAAAAAELGGPIDVLVNSAGIYRITPLLELRNDEWSEVLDVNLRGSFLVAREVVRRLVAAGRGGAIVNLSSIAALVADAAEPAAHYNASKAGVVALTKQMAVEWARYDVRVNAVCPGVIDTPVLRLMDDPAHGQAYLEEAVPLRRFGRPEEVARVIAFLASDEASYVTGVAVPIDGGATAQ